MKIHRGLTPERWFAFSRLEQLANVGTDVERIIFWRDKENIEYSMKAFERALELLDLTIADPKNRKGLKELVRVREALVDYFMYDNSTYRTSDEFWHKYFWDFGYAAARQRGR